ncbi:YdeI/OmpD-associated family protein [Urechidicola vernalis]|uniref:YdeI/OmpD-associated family protein n=1 Tax=Urechidicola vernalis TaxID=3075600 RepID=A0ABU2Y0R8_9FLAO|nr:YdeI/OmpD-associated family protein [Urechidicola sp. P050]MDT0551769.1 YdeI/OmpD-associated family protein [Urechidicola sp. P050]
MTKPQLYFERDIEWRKWLHENHKKSTGVYLIFYKVSSSKPSMRWEEAVKVALCYGWIDSTVKRLDDERRQQYFSPRKSTSVWSKLNKTYIKELTKEKLLQSSGIESISIAKQNGSWDALNDVDNEVIPPLLLAAFKNNPIAFSNYKNFAPSYRRGYLYWLYAAKRETTQQKRILEIIKYCSTNKKQRDGNW